MWKGRKTGTERQMQVLIAKRWLLSMGTEPRTWKASEIVGRGADSELIGLISGREDDRGTFCLPQRYLPVVQYILSCRGWKKSDRIVNAICVNRHSLLRCPNGGDRVEILRMIASDSPSYEPGHCNFIANNNSMVPNSMNAPILPNDRLHSAKLNLSNSGVKCQKALVRAYPDCPSVAW
jgi:hypothetical protein